MIEKILIQVEDWPGYMICDIKSDMYSYYGFSVLQSTRKGLEE